MKYNRDSVRGWLAYAWRRTLHNWPQKVAALLLAVGLWYIATADRRATVDRSFTVPVQVVDETSTEGRSRRSVTGIPEDVRVTLSGSRSRLNQLSDEEIAAIINVTNLPEGPFQRPISVRAPQSTRVVRADPTVASGFLDTELTRTLPVRLSVSNLPSDAIPRFDVNPRAVQVTGPQRLVESVVSVITVPVSIPQGSTVEARLIAVNAEGEPVTGVRLNPATVSVERIDRLELPVKTVSVELPRAPEGLRIVSSEVSPPNVRVLADPQTLARLQAVRARVPIREGRYSARAELELPEGARSLDEVTVTLNVERVPVSPEGAPQQPGQQQP